MRKLLLALWLLLILSGICSLFWYNEWRYTLPTPVPQNYVGVKIGDPILLSNKIQSEGDKPLFIHFFNPDCPCSRFNVPHFKSLVKKYGDKISFAVVVINKDKIYAPSEIKDKYDLDVPVICDTTIASACGVYSTPQAVIIDNEHHLYYRGNYNKSRYCTDTKSEYAQMAIDSLLSKNSKPAFNKYALTPYGCQVGYCKK
ncbi:MAG: hypothetical protein JWO06_1013 [Bacteroidota bacterium]|nr:hypothetical protein [Bacteroidota bacterium]